MHHHDVGNLVAMCSRRARVMPRQSLQKNPHGRSVYTVRKNAATYFRPRCSRLQRRSVGWRTRQRPLHRAAEVGILLEQPRKWRPKRQLSPSGLFLPTTYLKSSLHICTSLKLQNLL